MRLLEKQGAYSKAQFIVNAILYQVNCMKTPDIFGSIDSEQGIHRKDLMEFDSGGVSS